MNGYEAKFYSERQQRQIDIDLNRMTAAQRGPHNTSTARLNQIADDLYTEGWYTISATIVQAAEERDELVAALKAIAEHEYERDEWDGVERIIPAMREIARAVLAKMRS